MTARQLYEGVLVELNKENAPNILLESFNYFANKAINQYINKRYNIYDINLQTTDDLRVLKATALLKPIKNTDFTGLSLANGANYEVTLPSDYLHLLNCICIYDVKKTYKCYNAGDTWRCPATRLTADLYSQVLDNFWNKPDYKRPYYYIHNVNEFLDLNSEYTQSDIPTDPIRYNSRLEKNVGTDFTTTGFEMIQRMSYVSGNIVYSGKTYTKDSNDVYEISGLYFKYDLGDIFLVIKIGENNYAPLETLNNYSGYSNEDARGNKIFLNSDSYLFTGIKYGDEDIISTVERTPQVRYGNASTVRMEIRYGSDDSIFALRNVYVDYIKAPQHIRLTQRELDYTEDKSQVLEFPDYVCQEIINELVHLIMENIGDPKLQTHPVVSLSIANPAQALAPEQTQQQ